MNMSDWFQACMMGPRYVRNVRKVAIIGQFNCMCDKLTFGKTECRRQLQVLG